MIKASIIVAIYKDIEALDRILDSLYRQSFQGNYEVIIAEDGQDSNVFTYVSTLNYPNLKHTTQDDLGWRKNRSLNNAIKAAEGEFLIFIDGDCIPSHHLIKNYLEKAKEGEVLCGRRVELGANMSTALRQKKYFIQELEAHYFLNLVKLAKDKARHFEEGIILNTMICQIKYRSHQPSIIGCNFGAFKRDILSVNGFDESYTCPSVGEDTDLQWRMSESGYNMSTVRNRAPVFHLYHANTYSKEDNIQSNTLFDKRQLERDLICKDGIRKL